MAGELLVVMPNQPSIGFLVQVNRELADAPALIATMIVILVIGVVVDTAVFGTLDRAIRRRWGLVERAP